MKQQTAYFPANYRPRARDKNLIIKELADEVLVYDIDSDAAHCLNKSCATIWKLCDGVSPPSSILESFQRQFGPLPDERFVWLALNELSRTGLLSEPVNLPADISAFSRREIVRRLGLAATVALPLIVSLTAPTAAQAGSCKHNNIACVTSEECCSGICDTIATHRCVGG